MTWLAILAMSIVAQDLDQIRAENDPPKRATKAMEFAAQKFTDARQLSIDGDFAKMNEALDEMADGTELAAEAIEAKRNVGVMKRAEQRCRDLLRRLDTLKSDLPAGEQASIDPIEKRLHAVQEGILGRIMGKRK